MMYEQQPKGSSLWALNHSMQFAFWDLTLPNGSSRTLVQSLLGKFVIEKNELKIKRMTCNLFLLLLFDLFRGFAAGIYTTNTPEACAYVGLDSRANIFVVEDEKQLAKVLEIRDQLPELKAIIQYTGEPNVEGVYSWSKLMMIGSQQVNFNL